MSAFLDHIIWACDNLEQGTRRFEALTGVTPRYGGVHASGTTHNALVAVGARCYLEILAPTAAETPEEDAWCRLARQSSEPRIMTYCQRSPRPLSQLAQIAEAAGAHRSVVANNGRVTPEGVRLHWQWVAPVFGEFGLAFPFFIDWLDSPHPASTLQGQADIRLEEFAVGHPQATALLQALEEVGTPIDTYTAAATEFRVRLLTPRGVIAL